MPRRSRIETSINHDRWLVSYADFITLLFAFFVVMYSVSQVNENKYRTLSETLEIAFSGDSSGESSTTETTSETAENGAGNVAELTDIAGELGDIFAKSAQDGEMTITGNEQWLEIELNANLLFPSGSAILENDAKDLLAAVAEVLSPYDNAIAVEGHTDNLPIANDQFNDNWELSSSRAVAVVSMLSYQNINPQRLSAVGLGEYRPVVSNDDEQGRARNRRVVVKIARNATPAQKQSIDDYIDETADSAVERVAVESTKTDGGALVVSPPPGAEVDTPQGLAPVRLKGGGLLFSSDPDLPRNNPPVDQDPEAK